MLRRVVQALTALIFLPLAGCGSSDSGMTTSDQNAAPAIVASVSGTLPYESLQDWVSYADAVVVVRVIEEAEIPATQEEVDVGEGMTLRDVTVEIEDTLWRRGGPAPVPPNRLTFATWGWTFKGDERRPMSSGEERLEVGNRYLIPMAAMPDQGWGPISTQATTRVDSGTVAEARSPAHEATSVATVTGESLVEVKELLAAAEPYPAAQANAALDPVQRFEAVVAAGEG